MFKQMALVTSETDNQVWEMVTVMPVVHKGVAVVVALINILLPGLGSLIMAYMYEESFSKVQMVIAFSQFFLSPIIIGWIWA